MSDTATFRKLAMSLPGTQEKPHFDRAAFSVDRIYATLDSAGLTANLKFTPDEQEFKRQLAPDVFQPIDNGWGRQGWTTMILAAATDQDVRAALEMAHAHAIGKPRRKG